MLASLGMEILRLQHGWRSSPKDDLNTILSVAFPQLFTNSPCSDRTERNEEDKYLLVRESGVPMEQTRLRKLALPFPMPALPQS